MPNTSNITKAIATRIPTDVYQTIERRIKKSGKFQTVPQYIRQLVTWYVRREHS
jgi:hypothetical protein